MKTCFFNYYDPPGAKWHKISDYSEKKSLSVGFIISSDGYRRHKAKFEPTKIIRSDYTGKETINQIIFMLKAAAYLIKSKYELYIILTQPPLYYIIATIILKLLVKKYYLYTMDLYPENLDFNKPLKLLNKMLYPFAKFSYRNADKIMVIGRDMQNILKKRYDLNNDKFFFQRNWASLNPNGKKQNKNGYSVIEYGLYAGNMGYAHDFTLIKQMLLQLKGNSVLDKFYFVGKGAKKQPLMEFCKANDLLGFVEFKGFLEDEEFSEIVSNALFHTICLSDHKTGIMVPSKFYTSVEAHKPVLYFGSKNSEIAMDIEEYNLGIVVDREMDDYSKLVQKFKEIDFDPYLKHYSENINNADIAATNITEFLEQELEK